MKKPYITEKEMFKLKKSNFWKENVKDKHIKIKTLEERISNLIHTIKNKPDGKTDASLLGELGKYAIEYRQLTGRPYRVKEKW